MPSFPGSFGRSLRLVVVALLGCLLTIACAPPDVRPLRSDTSTSKKKKTPPKSSTDDDDDDGIGAPTRTPGAQGPTLSAVSPASVAAGDAATTNGLELTLTGTRFVSGCKVDVDGASLDATLASPTELHVRLPATQLGTARVLPLVVKSPKGDSNALSFTVANPTSVVIQSLAPQSATAGTASASLTVRGSGYVSTSTILFNGASLPTTFRSGTELTAVVPATSLADAGRISVTVTSGAGVVSLPSTFEVTNPAPQLTTVTPGQVTAGSGDTSLTVTGSSFTRASEVIAGQTPLATTFVSATQLRATLPAGSIANATSIAIRVQTPAPGGGSSVTKTITVQGGGATGGQQTTTCSFTCAEYGYDPGECYQGWACNGATGCLYTTTCSAGGGAQGGGAGNASCAYACSDYNYDPGECVDGWICIDSGQYAGCLGQTTC